LQICIFFLFTIAKNEKKQQKMSANNATEMAKKLPQKTKQHFSKSII
jgi:hypothetical protein